MQIGPEVPAEHIHKQVVVGQHQQKSLRNIQLEVDRQIGSEEGPPLIASLAEKAALAEHIDSFIGFEL